MSASPIRLGDPVPWFGARTVTGASVDLHVDAGRWVVLAFAGAGDRAQAARELAPILAAARPDRDDRIVAYVVLAAPPDAVGDLARMSGPGLAFIADPDDAIAERYGAKGAPRTLVLDPMLRAVANIAWDHQGGHAEALRGLLAGSALGRRIVRA